MTAPAADPLARLKYLVGYQLWPKWEALPFCEEALAQAQAENDDPRLVAAYILEQICEDARTHSASAEQGGVKRVRVGEIDIHLADPARNVAEATAAAACARAAELRQQASASLSSNPAPILEPWGLA
ncbi:hypothetical protein [Deinococcus sp. SL84]|uniref:hypothetical protein n=1 Tax=Deinococcus sp. SL84 TaxID=2994663 RepID=UPI002274BFDF|nr:hypothetical protein [Deinococcus sp. SL84]MCY1703640.1 hypothetical protein [Deinococcus sp. SL84]